MFHPHLSRAWPGWGAAWVLLLVLLRAAGAAAAPPQAARPEAPRLLPARTLVYFRVASVPELVERFQRTGVGRLANDPQLKPLLGQFWQMAADAYGRIEQELETPLAELLTIPQGEMCLAVVAPPEGSPQFVAWIDCGEKVPTVQRLLARAEQELVDRGAERRSESLGELELVLHEFRGRQRPLVHAWKEQTLIVASSTELVGQVVAIWNGAAPADLVTLADNRQFTAIMNRSRGNKGETPQITWFADPMELARSLGQGNLSAQAGLAVLNGLGLDGIRGLGGSMVFATEEFDRLLHTHILLESPRRGVLPALAMRTGDVTPELWVASDVESYTTVHWDLRTTYDTVVRTYEMFRGGEGSWDGQVLLPISDRLGIDLERDFIHRLAGRVTLISWLEKPARVNSQSTLLAIQVTDTDAMRKTIETVTSRFPDRLTRKSFAGETYFVSPLTDGRRPDLGEGAWREEAACVMLFDDYLFFSNNEKLIQKVITTRRDPADKLAQELDFKIIASRISRQLGEAPAGMIAFRRPEEGMRQLYELAQSENLRLQLKTRGEQNAFFKGVDQALGQNPLPPFSVIARYLSPNGALATHDETGFHFLAFTLRRD